MSNNKEKINLESLKGIYDRYPEEWRNWKKLVEIVDETAEEFGFRQIDPPSIERQQLWTSKENEEIVEQMYAFTDKGSNEVALIPEQTPTRARLIQKRKDLKTPIKWYCTSKRWRYEDVTKGRDREFRQGDFDIFGIKSVEADAEIIACAATIYQKLGVEDRVEFLINDRKLLESVLKSQGINKTETAMKIIDDKEKMDEEEFLGELQDQGISRTEAEKIDDITEISGPITEEIEKLKRDAPEDSKETVNRIEKLANALEAYGVEEMCRLDLSIVRGLSYYTGLVFEAFDAEGELRALFGGGRYDNLVGKFGERDIAAVGFGFGYSTTMELLKDSGKYPLEEIETNVYILTVSSSVRKKGLKYARKLRQKKLTVETDLSNRGFGDQLGYADSINAKKVLIVGEKDLKDGKVTIKDMGSGEEEKVGEDNVVDYFESQNAI